MFCLDAVPLELKFPGCHRNLLLFSSASVSGRKFYETPEAILDKVVGGDFVRLDDFNANNSDWYSGDCTNHNGIALKDLTDHYKFALRSVYLTLVRPILEYAQLAWSGLSATDNRKLERLQRRAARLITGEHLGEQSRGNIEHDLLLSRAGLSTLSSRRRVALCMLAFDFVHC